MKKWNRNVYSRLFLHTFGQLDFVHYLDRKYTFFRFAFLWYYPSLLNYHFCLQIPLQHFPCLKLLLKSDTAIYYSLPFYIIFGDVTLSPIVFLKLLCLQSDMTLFSNNIDIFLKTTLQNVTWRYWTRITIKMITYTF